MIELWGSVKGLGTYGNSKKWTDGAVFINDDNIKWLIEKGAESAPVHVANPGDSHPKEYSGIICYMKFNEIMIKKETRCIEDSQPIICKICSLSTWSENLETTASSITFKTKNSHFIGNIEDTKKETSNRIENNDEQTISEEGVINLEYFVDRDMDIRNLSLVKIHIEVGAVSLINELIVLQTCENDSEKCLTGNIRECVEDLFNLNIPVSVGMKLFNRFTDVQRVYTVVACLPHSQGLLAKGYVLSIISSIDGNSPANELTPEIEVTDAPKANIDLCNFPDIPNTKMTTVVAQTLVKNKTSYLKSEMDTNSVFCHVYAGWELISSLELADMKNVVLLSPTVNTPRIVCLRAIHNLFPLKSTIFLPPDLTHNLKLDPDSSNVLKICLPSSLPEIPIATKVVIGIAGFKKEVHLLLLQKYFYRRKKMFMSLGDILTINATAVDEGNLLNELYILQVPAETIFELFETPLVLEVLSVESHSKSWPFLNGAIFELSSTNLELKLDYQNKIVPAYSFSYTSFNHVLFSIRSEHCLRQPFNELIDILRLYFSQKHNFSPIPCTILLTSPNESSLDSWVMTASDSIGFHIECLTHTISSSPEGNLLIPITTINSIIEKVSRYPKSVLLLSLPQSDDNHLNSPPDNDTNEPLTLTISYIISSIKSIRTKFVNSYPPILISTFNSPDPPSSHLLSLFLYAISEPHLLPSYGFDFVSGFLKLHCLPHFLDIKRISRKLSGFSYDVVKQIFKYALKLAQIRKTATCSCTYPPVLIEADLDASISTNRTLTASFTSANAPVKLVSWNDLGGLSLPKKLVLDTISLMIDHPTLLPKNLTKSPCMLFYGPPGTGKTFLARAIASNLGLNFIAIKGPEILSPYVGESESNLRKVFLSAIESSPCLIFFDEIDSISKARKFSSSSNGVNDRLVSQLLTEIDVISSRSKKCNVFVIGATNRPDLIDPALMRSGRFSKLIYLGPCESSSNVLSVLKAITRKFHMHPSLDLNSLVARIPLPITNADIYGICSSAYTIAIRRMVNELDTKRPFTTSNDNSHSKGHVVITEFDFIESLDHFRPSIDSNSLKYYANFHKTYSKKALDQKSEHVDN